MTNYTTEAVVRHSSLHHSTESTHVWKNEAVRGSVGLADGPRCYVHPWMDLDPHSHSSFIAYSFK